MKRTYTIPKGTHLKPLVLRSRYTPMCRASAAFSLLVPEQPRAVLYGRAQKAGFAEPKYWG